MQDEEILWYARPGLYKGVFTFELVINMRQLNVITKGIKKKYIYIICIYINMIINKRYLLFLIYIYVSIYIYYI